MTPPAALAAHASAPRRRRFGPLPALTLGTLLALALVECAFRTRIPPPRVILVRATPENGFRIVDGGVPLWLPDEPELERCETRRPGATRIAFFGSSITFGVEVPRAETFAHRLEPMLVDATPGGVCSDNFAVAGFGTAQMIARVHEELPRSHPRIVVLEIWDLPRRFAVAGGVAFDARQRELDAANVPTLPGVPSWLADPLFSISAAYQYAAFTLSPVRMEPSDEPRVRAFCDETLPALARRVSDAGASLVLLQGSPTDREFPDTFARRPPLPDDEVAACAQNAGFLTLRIAELLIDEPVARVRLDTSCHLNALGHEALAERLAPLLRTMLRDASP